MEILLRRATADDIDAVLAIERASFGDPWSREAFVFALSSEAHIFDVAYDVNGGRVVGFAVWMLLPPEGELCDIAISPEVRRCGVGRMLVEGGISRLHGAENVYLEVRESNTPAASLYKKVGFVPIGRRKNYYTSPREDAIVMKRSTKSTN